MKINVSYNDLLDEISFTKSENVPSAAWNLINTDILNKQSQIVKNPQENIVICEKQTFDGLIGTLESIVDEYGIELEFDNFIKKFLEDYYENIKKAEEINTSYLEELNQPNEDELLKILKEGGLNIDRLPLTIHQKKCILKLVSISHGANFSVPGSGKTYVTISVFVYLQKIMNLNSLIVICPKNAFLSWDENIAEIVNEKNNLNSGFIRLVGTDEEVATKINSGHKNFITNYEVIRRNNYHVRKFMERNRTHLVLDESHKIKNNSEQSYAVRALSYAAIRRDILTGTPMPKSIDDLRNQLYFLWRQSAINQIILPQEISQNAISIPTNLSNFYVRTKKKDLGLKPITTIFEPVKMSNAQLQLYSYAVSPLLNLQSSSVNASNFSEIRRSLMRLIAISSNPAIVLNRMFLGQNNSNFYENVLSDFERNVIDQLDRESHSNKLLLACEIARANAQKGEKTIIWSFFRHNVEYLAKYMLTDLDAEYIHGSVDTGSDEDLTTREGKIKKFKENPNCFVMVANFAACSEGISLHKVCNNAIYIDRSYQAEHFLQSIDRIQRLGNNDPKTVTILESKLPNEIRNIDLAIKANLQRKMSRMGHLLNDDDLIGLAEEGTIIDEEDNDNSNLNDIASLAEDFLNS